MPPLHAFAAKCSNPRGLASSAEAGRIMLWISTCYGYADDADASGSGLGSRQMHGLIDPYVALLDLLDERARIEFPQASRHFEQLCRAALPLLDQIPGLGDAFGHQDNSTARTELIIFIRP